MEVSYNMTLFYDAPLEGIPGRNTEKLRFWYKDPHHDGYKVLETYEIPFSAMVAVRDHVRNNVTLQDPAATDVMDKAAQLYFQRFIIKRNNVGPGVSWRQVIVVPLKGDGRIHSDSLSEMMDSIIGMWSVKEAYVTRASFDEAFTQEIQILKEVMWEEGIRGIYATRPSRPIGLVSLEESENKER